MLFFIRANITPAEDSDGNRVCATINERYSPVTVYLAHKYVGPTFSERAAQRGDREGRYEGKL